ncbi:probable chlorophyll(ide) b reductase NYC1, chloroplastic [Selaginella moellendorffii]|nr:probable chlorophyll(ide) b reductase NYC1, chloroplastic [Selaginella moellendorffii]|eukprot:XP_002988833.2 probable chlorophyll(ide) b reductase NYC1, chloroplastic [Selaginella moellendorffii]
MLGAVDISAMTPRIGANCCPSQASAIECKDFCQAATFSRLVHCKLKSRRWIRRRVSCSLKRGEDSHESSSETRTKSSQKSGFWNETEIGKLVGPLIHVLNGSAKPEAESSLPPTPSQVDDFPGKIVQVLSGTSSPWSPSQVSQFKKTLRWAENESLKFARKIGKGMFVVAATGAILATGLQLSDGDPRLESWLWFSWLAGLVIGSMIGSKHVLESNAKPGPLNIVITGSTRGLGKALAREFLRAGDNVIVASRSHSSVASTVEELTQELEESSRNTSTALSWPEKNHTKMSGKVVGTTCNVSNSDEVKALAEVAMEKFGSIDIWINNAGVNKGFKPLTDFDDEEIEQIVSTNLVGSMICTREAIRVMKKQPKKGHIFNMDGAGSNGAGTPLTAVYGASKSGLRQLHESLRKECRGSRVGIHTASPGMVLTDLLLSGASLHNKKMFNIICEQPETVARDLVPKMRRVKGTGKAIEYLTPPRIILAIITAWLHRGRWFDEEGRAVYAAEADRLRVWAEERQRSNFASAMETVPSGTWVSLFSSSVICAYIILANADSNLPGT